MSISAPLSTIPEMRSSLLPFPTTSPLPPAKSLTSFSSPLLPASTNPISTLRLGSKSHLGGWSAVSAYRGDMTELPTLPSLGRSSARAIQEDGESEEAEAILHSASSDLDRGFSWSDVEPVLNQMSKWVVSALFGLVILWKHDAEVLWAAMGSVINAWLAIQLKQILKHERPISGLRSDPGMPSSHAQSIFYAEAYAILSMVHQMGFNLFTMTSGAVGLIFGSYLSWLRVSQRLHTSSQVFVGALLGSAFGTAWFWLWDSFVSEAFISSLWVRFLVVTSSVTFCGAFVLYVIQNWLKDEL